MEVKIQCACGTKYKFDVEPVNSHMPGTVQCPTFGADGTEAANQYLVQAGVAPKAPVVRVSARAATPAAFDSFVQKNAGAASDARVEYAKEAVKNTTDQEIREFLAMRRSTSAASVTLESITATDLSDFKQEPPELKALAQGKLTKARFSRRFLDEMNSAEVKAEVLRSSVSWWALLWLVLGASSARRLDAGTTE